MERFTKVLIMNIYYYLFFKLSEALNKKGNNEWGPIAAITFLVCVNMGLIYIKAFPVSAIFNSGHKLFLIILGITLFLTNTVLFLDKKRYEKILNCYKRESLKSKRIGSFFVVLYIVITLTSIFFA